MTLQSRAAPESVTASFVSALKMLDFADELGTTPPLAKEPNIECRGKTLTQHFSNTFADVFADQWRHVFSRFAASRLGSARHGCAPQVHGRSLAR
jgi:hypothetical protein